MHVRLPSALMMLPFAVLVLCIAVLPLVAPHVWEKRRFQALIVAVCSAPVVVHLSTYPAGFLLDIAQSYASFICTLGALFVAAGGVYATADLEATPRNNVLFLIGGSLLASVIGTTGASMLLIRPLLRTNSGRAHTPHLVPFFILMVANAGGLLTPLGDPPLLIGYVEGVPFFWTLRLWPVWLLYVGSIAVVFYVVDTRAFARESPAARAENRDNTAPFGLRGAHNLGWFAAIVVASLLAPLYQIAALLVISAASYFGTSRAVHRANQFSFAPIVEVALLFAGLFACLPPVEGGMANAATSLPLRHGWQLFWGAGLASAILDNAPTYAAFAALARGLSDGREHVVAGITQTLLVALSAGSVVMGATTYIGNGPNLMVKAIAERSGHEMPSFARFAAFAFLTMLPAHLVMTAALAFMEN